MILKVSKVQLNEENGVKLKSYLKVAPNNSQKISENRESIVKFNVLCVYNFVGF